MVVLLGLFALLIYINVRITRRLLRSDLLDTHRGVLLCGVWLVPFFGALAVHQMFPPAPGADDVAGKRPPGVVDEPATAELRVGEAPPFLLAEHMKFIHGMPVPDWSAAAAWVAGLPVGEQPHARELVRRAWLLHMRDALGEHCYLHESEHAYLLSSLEANVASATASYVATTRKRVGRVLDGIAHFAPGEKSILLVMDDEEAYYDYVARYYPVEGEFAFSGGMFINAGCPHFVVRRADLGAIEPVIAHELTHSAVNHLRLPLWVDEGLAVNTEQRLTGAAPALYSLQEMRGKHLDFWGATEIQEFWSGLSFHRGDDGNMLSYDLARILVEQMGRDWPAFIRFAAGARREDAGLAAAREAMGVDLPAFVCGVLGREPDEAWVPNPVKWGMEEVQPA